MMNRFKAKQFLYRSTQILPFAAVGKFCPIKFIFPFYHTVSDEIPPHAKHLYRIVSVSQFKKDLEFLLKHFSPATFDDVKNFVASGKRQPKPSFFLSFDDGARECSDIVCPILKQKGIQAAFFINPAFIGNQILSHRHKISLILEKLASAPPSKLNEIARLLGINSGKAPAIYARIKSMTIRDIQTIDEVANFIGLDFGQYLHEKQPSMDWAQIGELQANGFLVGSHSYSHPEFYKLGEEEKETEITLAFRAIEENLNPPLKIFAFPFTDEKISDSFFDFIRSEGVEISFGTAGLKNDPQPGHIQRIAMDDGPLKSAEQIIRSEYAYYLLKSLFGKNSINRK